MLKTHIATGQAPAAGDMKQVPLDGTSEAPSFKTAAFGFTASITLFYGTAFLLSAVI